jgi:Tol biopolymer transport system component
LNHAGLLKLAISGVVLAASVGATLISTATASAVLVPRRPATPEAITQLTRDAGNALRPVWSPNGRFIAFDSNREGSFHIYVMNADGSDVRALTSGANDDRHPFWARDGKSIVYDSADGGHQDIWSVNLQDGERTQLTHADGLADFAAPSPDGQRIAYYVYNDFMLEIWSAWVDGSDARPLTIHLADAQRHQPTMAWHQVAWSADSQWIAYTGGDGRSIWLMRADGSDPRPLIADDETNHFPWFLADGRLAFITEYVPPKYGAAWTNAWAYDLQTGQRTLLLEFMCMQGPMDINIDKSQVLFSSPRGGRFDIYLINVTVQGGPEALHGPLTDALVVNAKY